MSPTSFTIRAVAPADVSSWRMLRHRLWPRASADDHARETEQLLAEPHRNAMVIAVSSKGEALGFAEAAIRHDYVNGCDTSPVLFLEGIYVIPDMRRRGIARALCSSVEQWGTSHGCVEFASDTAIDNIDAQTLHRALGFDETERVVFYRKRS
ncbi:GNAT family N-acetyltransferase [Paraburkholderia sp. NMBU_R16]|uniref:aminoglycoside 6'-N-acetyltransferase n=1 Tax=Paraburkholderia sp. NMBU_R16 TaxID=2698676 RepID=UPI001567027F|nr:aminoglycoside 6'-N-acetyltransferase [Paraburkholderia sp. NMBU_R16]NRO99489.1 GNAT family N-acetyltransferase [Paraburkholderia sp. NMBU_R16]